MSQRIFSGVQPSGNLHIGNYLGAIKNWVKLQDEFESIFCVVDLHAITIPQDPKELKKKTLEVVKAYIAAGIDPKKSTIFVQSQVSEHSELCWILNTITKVGDLTKMTQLKDKANFQNFDRLQEAIDKFSKILSETTGKISELSPKSAAQTSKEVTAETITKTLKEFYIEPLNKSGVGLFDYPILMAADILLYDTQIVPVGEDQLQHVELARTLAKRFNQKFGETFVVPEPKLVKEGARIMGLDDPTKKMSKSAASKYNYIALTDDAEIIQKKIKKAVTDSGSEIVYSKDKPALENLINIYSLFSEKTPKDLEKMYQGKGYAEFKDGLAEEIIKGLKPIQEKMKSLSDNEALKILKSGAEKIRPIANEKLTEIKKRIGFIS